MPEKKLHFLRSDFTPFMSIFFLFCKQLFLLLFPKDSEALNILDIWIWEVGEKRRLNRTSKSWLDWLNDYLFIKPKFPQREIFFAAILHPLSLFVLFWDHFFPLFFPKDSESQKILDLWQWEVGAKWHLNGTSKVNTRTNTRTNRQTDKSTYRKHGQEGRCFENKADMAQTHGQPNLK